MPTRKRIAMTISIPPDIAREYEAMARIKGETKSQLFREMFNFYRQERLEDEFFRLQKYGAKKARGMKLTEKDIERLIFEGR
ncbi:MAG: hypothetical protein QMC83_06995 [Thermodesulfovibrionales bacterium]|nr:hypothetical protein [Thermodesulfovibrionales bacterium]